MWDDILDKTVEDVPKPNGYMIREYRRETMAKAPMDLDAYFKSINWFDGKLQYVGYRRLEPHETVAKTTAGQRKGRQVFVSQTTSNFYMYNFVFNGMEYSTTLEVPYIDVADQKILINGTSYYPKIAFTDQLLVRTRSMITIKVSQIPMRFKKNKDYQFESIAGRRMRGQLIEAKIHWGRGGQSKGFVPVSIYHFAEWGYEETLKRYDIDPDDIQLVVKGKKPNEDAGYTYVRVRKSGLLLRVNDEIIDDREKCKILVQIIEILKKSKNVTIEAVYDPSGSFFKIHLGRLTFTGKDKKPGVWLSNAIKHMDSNRQLLTQTVIDAIHAFDPKYKDVKELNDLLMHVVSDIDRWFQIQSVDLTKKKVGGMDLLLTTQQEHITRNYRNMERTVGSRLETQKLTQFLNKCPARPYRIAKSQVLIQAPDIINDNAFFAVWGKRSRLSEAIERSTGSHQKCRISPATVAPHWSHIACESFFTIPSSTPIITGAVNPYMEIDENGTIIFPEWAYNNKHVYD